MRDNVLIPLPGFRLPGDFPWRVGFVSLVNEQLRRLRTTGHFLPPRFFGYFFQAHVPIGIGGSWTVSLDAARPASLLPGLLERVTHGQYSITSTGPQALPDYLLIHDRRDGSCWLWTYAEGVKFVEAVEPTTGGWDGAETPPTLQGP